MLRFRIKTQAKDTEFVKMTLKDFFRLYFNNLYDELNSILSDYHSIQEHSNRSKIVEFVNKKQKDFDLLQIFVRGAFLNSSLALLRYKSDDAAKAGIRIVEIADFLATLYENMKISFLPTPNFDLSLQTHINTSNLIPKPIDIHEKKTNSFDFTEIHRLMNIYVLKEDIKDFVIDNGILTINSVYFSFELALGGDFENPQWQLYKVNSFLNYKLAEEQIQRRLTSIKLISDFIVFFESRKKANDVFNELEVKTGVFYNFTGTKKALNFKGHIKNDIFMCKIFNKKFSKELINPKINEISEFLIENTEDVVSKENKTVEQGREFRSDIFGPNVTFIRNNMFFCLSKDKNLCYLGKNSQICGLKFFKISLDIIDNRISGCLTSKGEFDYLFGSKKHVDDSKVSPALTIKSSNCVFLSYLSVFINFIDQNIQFFEILLGINDLSFTAKITNCLVGDFFTVDESLNLYNDTNVHIKYKTSKDHESLTENIVQKIRLLEIQHAFKGSSFVTDSKAGEKISLCIRGIKILISNVYKTDYKLLTEDCQKFSITQALQYTINFGAFYLHNIYPDVFLVSKIHFYFVDLFNEIISIKIENGKYKIDGKNTLGATRLNSCFDQDDIKTLSVLCKVRLANRFIALKKEYDVSNGQSRDDQIILKDGKHIVLAKEGLKYESLDKIYDTHINRALNTEREVRKYFK